MACTCAGAGLRFLCSAVEQDRYSSLSQKKLGAKSRGLEGSSFVVA